MPGTTNITYIFEGEADQYGAVLIIDGKYRFHDETQLHALSKHQRPWDMDDNQRHIYRAFNDVTRHKVAQNLPLDTPGWYFDQLEAA